MNRLGFSIVLALTACSPQINVTQPDAASSATTGAGGAPADVVPTGPSSSSSTSQSVVASSSSGDPASIGEVFATVRSDPSAPVESDAAIAFETSPGELGGCASQVGYPAVGQCAIYTCARPLAPPRPDAGPVTFSSDLQLTAGAQADGTYDATTSPGALWHDGGPVFVHAPGDTVPSFAIKLLGPKHITITEPAVHPTTIDRTLPFSFQWSATAAPVVSVSMRGDGGNVVVCRFPGAAGVGSVPASELSTIPAGTGVVAIATLTETSETLGPWHTYIGLRDEAFAASVTFQ